MNKITVRLSKVKNRNRCWVATYKTPFMDFLDVRDTSKDKLLFHFDEMENQMVVRLCSEMESRGSNINLPTPNNTYRSSLIIDNDIEEAEYTIVDSYEENDFIWHVLKPVA